MPTGAADNFAHESYGDISGVSFYGPAVKGFRDDRFPVSDRFIDPLFRAVLDRAALERTKAPKLVTDWNALTGWRDASGFLELPLADVAELIDGLAAVTTADLAPHAAEFAVTPDECLRCASAISRFLRERVSSGRQVYVERD